MLESFITMRKFLATSVQFQSIDSTDYTKI